MLFPKPTRWKSKKWRDAARGQQCTMQLEGCNGNSETTVLAHANGGGMGTKVSDYDAADMCSACHDIFDNRTKSYYTQHMLVERFRTARFATIENRLERGILK